jgi:uncharacterized protein (TIGR03083 family)
MDHLALLQGEVVAMTAALRAADPARPVRSCPGWDVAALTAHLTAVHEWALGALRNEGSPPYDEKPASPDDYADAAGALVARLQELPPDAPCWTFDRDDRTAAFWRRRQLQEVSVHRWDVEEHGLDPAVAEAGVDEVVSFFLPRQVHLGRTTLPPGTLVLDSGTRSWTIGGGDGPTATVHGTPAELDLLLWGRASLDLLRLDGDHDLAAEMLRSGLTP